MNPPGPPLAPSRKIGAVGLAGAVTVILVWAVEAFTAIDIPPVVSAAIATIPTFAAGYVVPEP